MNIYYQTINKELDVWHKAVTKPEGLLAKVQGGIQSKTRKLIPKKIQDAITAAMRAFTQTILSGSGLVTNLGDTNDLSLSESDYLVLRRFQGYKATATGEGAATGAGGFFVVLADLPALLGIQVKFLFDCAALYGYDTDNRHERLFMLYVFQLAYSGRTHRQIYFSRLADWDTQTPIDIDWEKLQIEYRDYLDMAKLLQLVPIIGAPVGAVANHRLMERLRENAMNAYRMRKLKKKWT